MNLFRQSLATFDKVWHALGVAEIDFVDDGQHRDLEQDGVQPGAFDLNVDGAVWQCTERDVFFIQPEQAQKIDKITFDEKPHNMSSTLQGF